MKIRSGVRRRCLYSQEYGRVRCFMVISAQESTYRSNIRLKSTSAFVDGGRIAVDEVPEQGGPAGRDCRDEGRLPLDP